MKIRCRRSSRRFERISLNLASMIDVTFLLLIYFMVTTVLATPEDRLSPTLQTMREEGAGMDSDFQPQVLEVLQLNGRPAYRLGGRVFEASTPDRGDPGREAMAKAVQGLPTDPGIFVKVYDGVPVGYATAAMQAARDAGFIQVTYVPATP